MKHTMTNDEANTQLRTIAEQISAYRETADAGQLGDLAFTLNTWLRSFAPVVGPYPYTSARTPTQE